MIRVNESSWYKALSEYEQPNLRKATCQLLDTFGPYLAVWILMTWMTQVGFSYWISLTLIVVGGVLLVRIFIFLHDCCHRSFFLSPRANRILGYISGILTFTSPEDWRRSHLGHHARVGDLDRRGVGDVWTLTVEEYVAGPKLKRLAYRCFRNPFILFGLGPAFVFLIAQRFPHKGAGKRERYSVVLTDLAVAAIIGVASLTIGLRTYVLIQLPIMVVAGAIGVWMFYVQHQFGGVYWARHRDWDPMRAALQGSSYYRLPKLLRWSTGNIGLHHVHHLRPRIPNYNLQRCYDDIPALQEVAPLTLAGSLKSLRMHLWDEKNQELVSFRSIKTRLRQTEHRS